MSNLAGRFIGIDRLTREECLNVVRKQPNLEFVPGSRWTYNSTAWVILAEVLEEVTGQSADKWVITNILSPLEMDDTQIESYVGDVMNNAAESYYWDEELGYGNPKSNRAIFGAAEVHSNIEDLVKWVNNYRTATIGGKYVNDLFLDPFILNDGLNSGYALGINNSSHRGLNRYRHTGSHEAFVTQVSYYPDPDLGIITISNFGGNGVVATTKIAELFVEQDMNSPENAETTDIRINKKKLAQLEGQYLISTFNRVFNLTIVDDHLTIGGRNKLIPIDKNTFRIEGREDELKMETTATGAIKLIITTPTAKEVYTQITPWSPSPSDLTAFESDYWSDELETVYHLAVKDEKLVIQHRWIGEITLKAIANDFFETDVGFYVKFNRNREGQISNLSISSGRTLDVKFQRKE